MIKRTTPSKWTYKEYKTQYKYFKKRVPEIVGAMLTKKEFIALQNVLDNITPEEKMNMSSTEIFKKAFGDGN